MLSIRYSEIPSYLHDSSFYKNLTIDDGDSELLVPSRCFKPDDTVATFDELVHILHVDNFWGLSVIPDSVLKFSCELESHVWYRVLNLDEEDQVPLLLELTKVFIAQSSTLLMGVIKSPCRFEIAQCVVAWRKVQDSRDSKFCQVSGEFGNLACLMLLHQYGYCWDECTCSTAAQYGNIDCLKYAHENGCPWDDYVIEKAANSGSLQCMIYAREQGLEWDEIVASAAAEGGQLLCLQHAHENGCPWDEGVTEHAAAGGHIDCLRYALERGCPAEETAPTRAARAGSVECLQLLREWGCPWDKRTAHNSALTGSLECLRFALENGCACPDNILTITAAGGSLACRKYLLEERGVPLDQDGAEFASALLCGQVTYMEYLLSVDCPLGTLQDGAHRHLSINYDILHRECYREEKIDEDDGESDEKREPLDVRVLKCLKLARGRGYLWDEAFVRFIDRREWIYPRCFTYMKAEDPVWRQILSNERD